MTNTVCAHYIVEKLDEISKKIEEDIKMNPDVDVFCDVGVEGPTLGACSHHGYECPCSMEGENNA